ncbi:hypothetical protein ACEWY4_024378 [Coilia grayii]|uniref:UPAR/Ly6 domain-containing protein n=1 Tax=Coilia grayii TaxID=363190 RepID=A0ABD1J059_9TELE
MAKVLWAIITMAACFILVEPLKCKKCSVGILGKCLFSSQQACSNSEDRCYTGKAEFNITGVLGFETAGCLANSSCVNSTGSVLGVTYTITRTCCSTDLCSAASTPHLPATTALSAALLVFAWARAMF